jgi:hypothetical protein
MKNVFVSVCLGLLLVSCVWETMGGPPPKVTFDEEEFNEQRAAWTTQNIQDYTFIFNATRYFVENGQSKGWDVLEGCDDRLDSVNKYWAYNLNFRTIMDIYSYIKKEAENGKKEVETGNYVSFEVIVSYDPVYHFPITWDIIRGFSDSMAAVWVSTQTTADVSAPAKYGVRDFQPGKSAEGPAKMLFDEEEFTRQRAAWIAQGIQDYSFTLALQSKTPPEGIFYDEYAQLSRHVIKNGHLAEITVTRDYVDGYEPDEPFDPAEFATIADIYAFIEDKAAKLKGDVAVGPILFAAMGVDYDASHVPIIWHWDSKANSGIQPIWEWEGGEHHLIELRDFQPGISGD